jgi:hypothetical protein
MMHYRGPIHLFTRFGQWNRKELKQITLLNAGENGNKYPHGVMIVTPKHSRSKTLAIPDTMLLEVVAEQLHKMELDVQLSGWLGSNPSGA